jgi:hypothetical protein
MDIKSILASAKEHSGGDLSAPQYDRDWRPDSGQYRVKVVRTRPGFTKTQGDPRIGVWLEITEGESQGKRWWDNIIIFEDNDAASAVSFGKLLAMGVEEATIVALNDMKAIAPLLDDWEGWVNVDIVARPGKAIDDDPYVNVYYKAAEDTEQAAPQATESNDEPEEEFVSERGF